VTKEKGEDTERNGKKGEEKGRKERKGDEKRRGNVTYVRHLQLISLGL
jgi:hypothetical protein